MIFSALFLSSSSKISADRASLRRQLRQEHDVPNQTAPADPLRGSYVSAHGSFAQTKLPLQQTDLTLAAGPPALQTSKPSAFLRALSQGILSSANRNAHMLNAPFLKKSILPWTVKSTIMTPQQSKKFLLSPS